MSITVKEIAEIAGVSRGTVDRALKNRSGISPETKKKILKIAEKYDYHPNVIGTALAKSGKTTEVAVILNSIGNPFFSDVIDGLRAGESEFSQYGIKLTISEFKGYKTEKLLELLNKISPNTKQLIVSPICNDTVNKKLQELAENGMNIVMLTGKTENIKNSVYIGCDYLKSGKIAGRLIGLLTGGAANVFVVTGSTLHKGHAQRVEGIKQILERDYPKINFLGVSENLDDDEIAYNSMKKVLNEYRQIDFVYITAGGVKGSLRAIKEQSRKIQVCTFDDIPIVRQALNSGEISATICQQPFEQGYQAVKAIFEKVIAKREFSNDIYSQLSIKVDQTL